MKCRHCQSNLNAVFIDLGAAPPSNAYLNAEDLHQPEIWRPLRALVCENCFLVQVEDSARADELFTQDYAYFSSYSTTWLHHARRFVEEMAERFQLSSNSHVVEIAANDGYLLQYVQERGIPCMGIEPAASAASAARKKGIRIIEDFFGVDLARRLAQSGGSADLAVANNVLAHTPDINDFAAGFAALLKPDGVASFEFPHLLRMVEGVQFDTIYHEHFSYLSLFSASRVFESNGLTVFDVEELPTHGGSLRVLVQRKDSDRREISSRALKLFEREKAAGVDRIDFYAGFQEKANRLKNDFLAFLIEAKREGRKTAAYGAAAKGNTLLNYAGVRPDLISWVVDRNPAKQGKWLPGSRIPIVEERRIREEKPDYIVILPWNLRREIMKQLNYIREWGGRFVAASPALVIL